MIFFFEYCLTPFAYYYTLSNINKSNSMNITPIVFYYLNLCTLLQFYVNSTAKIIKKCKICKKYGRK